MRLRRKEQYRDSKSYIEQQSLAYYAFKMNLYAQLALEIDKSLLTLSTAAIGLLVSLSTKDVNPLSGHAVTVAISFFISVVVSTLYSLYLSKKIIVDEHQPKNESTQRPCFSISTKTLIDTADFYSMSAFCAGIFSTFLSVINKI